MPKVLLTSYIDDLIIEELEKISEVRISPNVSEETLLKESKDVDVIVARAPAKITERIIKNAEKLKGIVRWGVGHDNIDVSAAKEKGIVIAYTPGANAVSVAEHVLCVMLTLARRSLKTDREFRKSNWDLRVNYDGIDIHGKKWALLVLEELEGKLQGYASVSVWTSIIVTL